jgi:helicase-like protein/SNF2 domain-containing protein
VLMMDTPSAVLPPANELRHYDVVLFSKPRFEREIMDGSDKFVRLKLNHFLVCSSSNFATQGRNPNNVRPSCNCLFYRDGMEEKCICLREEDIYRSPLKDLHWLRIIIDEGHEFTSATSNAVLVAERLVTAERRWVVSGTPARDRLYGVEADFAVMSDYSLPSLYGDDSESLISSEASTPPMDSSSGTSSQAFKMAALERRKRFNYQEDVGNASATKSLGLLAQHFLKLRPWYQEQEDQKVFWDDYIYRHEHFRNKTYSGFSRCLRQTLENLVVKTRPEDVERDIILPPLTHTVVRLEPSFYDKLTANLFVLVLAANAITSERTDVDYLFHKNSAKDRYRLIANLRQSNFFWTGFSLDDVRSAIKTSTEYLNKETARCSAEDRQLLSQYIEFAKMVLQSSGWTALSRNHEIGLFVESWPDESDKSWALDKCSRPSMLGAAQLLQAQSLVNSQLFSDDPTAGLQAAGEAASIEMEAKALEESQERRKDSNSTSSKACIPSSAVHIERLASKRTSAVSPQKSSKKPPATPKAIGAPTKKDAIEPDTIDKTSKESPMSAKLSRKRKREMDTRELDEDSALRKSAIIGTVSAKLTYLLDRINQFHKDEKIIVFYDGDNAAFYLSQCLDILHIKHLIYTKGLSSEQRSKYIVTFDADDSIRVLLMDIRCGAFGLNVNKASRVFFINPVCRPATEAQAIKRAHRIGQLKPVHVETLVLNDTIEAGIFERSRRMTQTEHFEANQLSDDKGIAHIIQTAASIPVTLEEGVGYKQIALLPSPLQIFGRHGRGDTKIKGIDRELDLIDGHFEDSPARPTKKRSKKGNLAVKKADIAPVMDAPILSGVEWMNQPALSVPESGSGSSNTQSQISTYSHRSDSSMVGPLLGLSIKNGTGNSLFG